MKFLSLLLFSASIAIASDSHAFLWHESRDEKTRELQFGFYVGPEAVKEVIEAEVLGDARKREGLLSKPRSDAWLFAVLLKGEGGRYFKDKILIARIDGHEPVGIVSGTIELERKKRSVKIDLQVTLDGKVVSFPGNGSYLVSLLPKK